MTRRGVYSIEDLATMAHRQGWRVERTKRRHWRFVPPDPRAPAVVHGGSPSDHRAIRNIIADLRRSGLQFPQDIEHDFDSAAPVRRDRGEPATERRPLAAFPRRQFGFRSTNAADTFEYRCRAEGFATRREGPRLVSVRAPADATEDALVWVESYARDVSRAERDAEQRESRARGRDRGRRGR